MTTRHIAAEDARLHDLTPEGSSGRASKRFRRKLAADGFTVDDGFRLKPGYLYTVVRAISARVNQNYDGWPSEELKKSYKTFIGKPVFVNHENHDPTKARGVVVAARYVENGPDRYIEVVQEVDAERFPKLAHEIKTGGLDSVSMGAEAGFTICSYCHNKATDLDDMCDHVRNHKGKTLTRFDKRTGKKEDVLVFESCHKISFFELSYVFEPADETAVASKVVVAGLNKDAKNSCPHQNWEDYEPGTAECYDCGEIIPKPYDPKNTVEYLAPPRGTLRENNLRTAAEDVTIPAPPGTPTVDQSVIDSTPVYELSPATELTGHEATGLAKSSSFDDDIAEITKLAGECPPGVDCNNMPDLNKELSTGGGVTPASLGQTGGESGGGYQGSGKSGRDGLNPAVRDFYDQIAKDHPDLSLGGYNPTVDQSWDEHQTGDAMDVMVSDLERGNSIRDLALQNPNTKHVIWQQKMWYPGGSSSAMDDRGSPTENHFDHVHINMSTPAGYKSPAAAQQTQSNGVAPTQRAAGKYTKDDFNHPSGLKPWERDKESDAEDAAAIEIEAMLLTASQSDDYWAWKAEHGEEADKEREYAPRALPNPALRRWVEEINRRTRHAAPMKAIPENSARTQRPGTEATYNKVHDFFDEIGAPHEGGADGVLDYGAGLGHGGRWGHTYEPHPSSELPPGVGNYPTWVDPGDVPSGAFNRVTNIHVLNVVPPRVRSKIVQGIADALAPGGHAVIVARSRSDVDSTKNKIQADGDSGAYHVFDPDKPNERTYQKGFTPDELHSYVSKRLGKGYTVNKMSGKYKLSAPAVHVVKDPLPAADPSERISTVKKIARQRALKLAFGEVEAPMAVDTLREEGSAPEDDDDDFERYVEPPKDLQTPDLSEAQQVDREQEEAGAPTDTTGGVPGAAEGGPAQGPQQQYMTLQIPMPSEAPQVPQQAAPPQMVQPPQDPAQQQPMQMAASTLDYFDRYYGRRVANWLDAIEARREMTPAEAADYRRQAEKLSTLENGREHSTTNRNPGKEPADMARNTIASRSKVARAGRRQHLAEGPFVDGGPYGRNDEGEQEEAFISQVPPAEPGDFVTDEGHIHNTEHNLVARVQQGRDQLLRDARQLAALRQRRAFDEAGGPTAEVVDPTVHTGPEGEALTGDDFVSANPNDGVVPTNPKDASLRAFQAFDSWLAEKTGKSSRRHTEANIKKAAAQFSREAGISPQALFPALGIVLREARKNTKKANTKGAAMRKRADEKLEVAAPDGRVDVEAPVENVTSAEAQASQFDIHDFGNNAGDDVAKPDLSTDQNWAPGEASGQKAAAIKTAGGLLAMRCAEGMIAAGLEPNSRERKYQLAAEFENMNRGLIQDRVALLERFAAVREADRRKVASGSSRGAARSPIPAGLGGGTRTAAAGPRVAAHDPSNDSTLFI